MSRTPEQRLWDRTKNNLAPFKGIRLERYENLVGVGCPDCLAICKGVVTWMESKEVLVPPVRQTTRLIPSGKGLSRDQKNWHLDWRQHGGRSIVLVGVGSDKILAVDNRHTDDVNDMPFNEMAQKAIAATWGELAFYLGWRP